MATQPNTTRRALVSSLAALPVAVMPAVAGAVEAEGEVTRLFQQWQPAVDAVWRADAAGAGFEEAYVAEHGIKKAICRAEALSLRELQMQAFAYTSDGCGLGGLAIAERLRASDIEYRVRNPEMVNDDHRIRAYSFAIGLMRMAEADPSGPRQPTSPLSA